MSADGDFIPDSCDLIFASLRGAMGGPTAKVVRAASGKSHGFDGRVVIGRSIAFGPEQEPALVDSPERRRNR